MAKQNKKESDQYERWPFPDNYFISREGLLLLRYLDKYLGGSENSDRRVIDIGCGTGNTLISLARRYNHIRFTGIDISDKSLGIATSNAAADNLSNIEFEKIDILDTKFGRLGTFDIVFCLGVLHHLRDMEKAIENLSGILRDDGRMILWFYGRYGRYKHALNQRLIKILSNGTAKSEKYSIARALIDEDEGKYILNTGFYSPSVLGEKVGVWIKENPQWLVDQFIPDYEKDVTMAELYFLMERNNLRISKWIGVHTDLENYFSSPLLKSRAKRLSHLQQLTAVDYLLKPEYYFVAVEKAKKDCGYHDSDGIERI